MLSSIKFLTRLALFWILFFLFFRILFFITQFQNTRGIPFSEWIKIFYAGFRLDLSAVCYLLAFPFILMVLQLFTGLNIFRQINLWLHAILIFFNVGAGLANITIYKEWGTLLNARAVSYVTQPKEIFASASNLQWFISLSIWTVIFIFFFYLFRKYANRFFPGFHSLKLIAAVQLLISLVVLAIGARGGVQLIPVNESAAYFSPVPLLNSISVNYLWYLGHSFLQSQITGENPFHYYDEAGAQKQVRALYASQDKRLIHILDTNISSRPNIVIIMLESWSADIIKALGGEKNLSPEFDKLKNDGVLFSNIYSSGFRTDQGIVSILSGFPAQPNQSIIRHPDKTEKLPSLIREFKNTGYKTSFYYGGEIAFANMNSYLLNTGCDKLITKDNFGEPDLSSKWGAYDEFVLLRQASDLNKEKEPFLSILLTLSTHEPFDIPIKNPFGDKTEPDRFRGAAYYTDKCLGKYFDEIKKQPWFNNTLFILLADHGHRLPKEHAYEDPLARRMTMMFYGNLIKPEFKGKIIDRIANQNDLAATLLSQFDLDHHSFTWSNDILNANRNSFAYISLDYGLNWLTPNGYFTYHFDTGNLNFPKGKENIAETDISNAKAYIQCLYKEYLDY